MRYLVLSLLLLFSLVAKAENIDIGVFDGDKYAYDASNVIYQDNIRLVWIITEAQKFNYSDAKDYLEAAGRFAIDCRGHNAAFLEGMTFNTKGDILQHGTVPKKKVKFLPIMNHTPQYTLYCMLCAEHPTI